MGRSTEAILEPQTEARKTRLRVSELALLLSLLTLSLIAWTSPATLPFSVGGSHATVGFLFVIAALALGEEKTGWRYWCRELLPVPVIPYVFLSLGRLIPLVNPSTFDQQLLALDLAILGREARDALYAIPLPAWGADTLTIAYSSFFFLPVALLVALVRSRDPYIPQVAAAIVITFVVSFIGYFFVPAYGPRTTVAQERYLTLPAGLVGATLRELLDSWEKTKTDAFPSGHTMVTLVTLYCARKRHRGVYSAILPVGFLLVAATLLLTYHYVVDVLVAIPLDVVSLALAALLAGPVRART